MSLEQNKRINSAREDLEALRGLRQEEAKSVLKVMSEERKRNIVALIERVRREKMEMATLDRELERGFEQMELGELTQVAADRGQTAMFNDSELEGIFKGRFEREDLKKLAQNVLKVDLTDEELERAYQGYSKGIFETGEWPELRLLLLGKGVAEKDANVKLDTAIVHAYRLQNPGADLPPYAMAA